MQGALDRFVEDALDAFPPTLDLVAQVGWDIQRPPHVVEQRLPAIVQHLAPRVDQPTGASLLLFEHDLRQRELRQVVTVVPVDNLDLVSFAHELRDAIKRYVATRTGVVQLAVCVLLDKVSFGGCCHNWAQSNAVRHTRRTAFFTEVVMAKRKRTSQRSDLVGRAVSAGRRALREAESRIPPDLRRQLDRRLRDADKTARAAIKTLQAQVKRASTRADVNSVLKRIDDLTKQARQIARGAGTRAAATGRRAATPTKRAATRTKKAATTTTTRRRTTRAAAGRGGSSTTGSTSGSSTARRTAPARRSRAAKPASAEPELIIEPEAVGEIEVFEITES
jgi:hypothetical protein